ncbi:uncharacterized protein LOC143933772 isoform X1 [Lithobates pipiens]
MIFKQHQFGPWVAVSVLLGVLVDVSGASVRIQLIPENPVIGGSVTMSVTGITGSIQNFIWYKGPGMDREYNILTYMPIFKPPFIPGPLNNSRMTSSPDGALQISNLHKTDEGNYILFIQTDTRSSIALYLKIREQSLGGTLHMCIHSAIVEPAARAPQGGRWKVQERKDIYGRPSGNLSPQRSKDKVVKPKFKAPASASTSFPKENDAVTLTSPIVCETTCPSGNGLDGGEIAVIVIGTVIGIFILEVIVYFVIKKKKSKPSGSVVYENVNVSQPHNNEVTFPGSGMNPTQESNYAQLSHKNRYIYSIIEPATGK